MDTETYFPVVVERILNRGSWADIRWLLQTYEQTALVEWIRRYGYRRLDKRALHFWCWIFDIQNVQKPPWEQTP